MWNTSTRFCDFLLLRALKYTEEKWTHENTVTLCPLDIKEASLPGSPHTLENLENQENDQINFQAWKRKKSEIPGTILEIF